MRRIPLLLVLGALSTGGLAGQEPPGNPTRPATDSAGRATPAPDTVRLARPGLGYVPARAAIELTVGLPGSGEAQQQPVRAIRTDLSGAVLDSTSLDRTLTVQGRFRVGLSGVLGLGRDWAIRLGVGWASARLETRYSGADEEQRFLQDANATPGTAADLQFLSIETGLLYRIPSSKRLQPYLFLGTALSQWSGRGTLPTVLQDAFGTRFEAAAGVGGVLPLSRRLSARLQVSKRLFRTPVQPRPSGDTLGTRRTPGWPPTRKENDRVTTLISASPTGSAFADGAREALDLLRLEVGISYDFRRSTPQPPAPRAEPPDTTSPPGR